MLDLQAKGAAMVNQRTIAPTEKQKIEAEISRTHNRGIETIKKIAELTKLLKWLEWMNAERRKHLKRIKEANEHGKNFTMWDTITVNTVPANPEAVAGYVGGFWPTFNELVRRFPHAKHLGIAVNAGEDATCLDIENGDASPEQAGPWAKRQKALGKKLVILYFSVSNKAAVEASLAQQGIKRNEVKFWGAHYTGVAHLEPGFDAIQWWDRALNRNLDVSLCTSNFLTP